MGLSVSVGSVKLTSILTFYIYSKWLASQKFDVLIIYDLLFCSELKLIISLYIWIGDIDILITLYAIVNKVMFKINTTDF